MSDAIALCTAIVAEAMPYSIAFALLRIIVKLFLGMAFNGRVEL